MSDITRLLEAAGNGDRKASEELLPLVYDELRKLAKARLSKERPGQTLQPTALVHEAYLRLQGNEQPQVWANRKHFFKAAAIAIRRILVENARRKGAKIRGNGKARLPIDEQHLALPELHENVLALHEALDKLARIHPREAELVELRYFGGLTAEEAAQAMSVSTRTAGNLWKSARAWLRVEIEGEA